MDEIILSVYDTLRIEKVKETLAILELNSLHLNTVLNEVTNSSANFPYHNAQHSFTVALNTVKINSYYHSAKNHSSHKLLFLAGLYHDFSHSGGKNSDLVNVCIAAAKTVELLAILEPELTNDDVNCVVKYILATEHPAHHEPTSIGEKIIRDSDLLQWCEPDIDIWLAGLAEELKEPVTVISTRKFFTTQILYTYKAKQELFKAGLIQTTY